MLTVSVCFLFHQGSSQEEGVKPVLVTLQASDYMVYLRTTISNLLVSRFKPRARQTKYLLKK